MAILTKRIYDPADPSDGFRLLVMRLWPRGIRKDLVSAWEKELGPSRKLLDDFHAGIPWAEYRMRYHDEMRAKPLAGVEGVEISLAVTPLVALTACPVNSPAI